MRSWRWELQAGYGMISGPVSGHRGTWDFDDGDTYEEFKKRADVSGLGAVVARIEKGYCDTTPSGGTRWIVAYPPHVSWRDQALARREGGHGEPTVKVLIEHTKFAILAPSDGSVHPSGRPYMRRSGGFDTIASVTGEEHEALVALARSFDQILRPRADTQHAAQRLVSGLVRPGEVFSRMTPWASILEPKGWIKVDTRGPVTLWRRPGKAYGVSATTNFANSDLFYVFTSSTDFDPERAYSKFAVYTILNHGGDFSAAARTLAEQGYGSTDDYSEIVASVAGTVQPGRPASSEVAESRLKLTTLEELFSQPDETVSWVVTERIACASVNVLAGKPKAGKSTLARDLALAVASGRDWLGYTCATGPVWYLALEDKASEVKRHFRQMGATGKEPVRFLFDQPRDLLIPQLQRLAEDEWATLQGMQPKRLFSPAIVQGRPESRVPGC